MKVKKGGGHFFDREREREEKEGEMLFFSFLRFSLRSMEIRPWVFIGAKGKVYPHDESYAWTQKSWSFIKLHEVGNFPTCVISSLKPFNGLGWLRGRERP